MFCSIQNSEQLLFWQKFDFCSNFGSILQKDRKGEDRLGYNDPMGHERPCHRPQLRTPLRAHVRARNCLPTCVTKLCGRPGLVSLLPWAPAWTASHFSPSQSKRTPTTIPCEIHPTRSLSGQIESTLISATPLRTQRTPRRVFSPLQSPGVPLLLQIQPPHPPRALPHGQANPGGICWVFLTSLPKVD